MGLYRSSDDKVIAGVCGGLAHKLGLSSGGLRIVAVIGIFFAGLVPLAYIACWILLPQQPTKGGGQPEAAGSSGGQT
ncbi:MAG: PspC domain-containing protein [Gammaproteobacteria bacterium]|nr:PspC domain-containing protein [Gammaproteobacteria bacterium]